MYKIIGTLVLAAAISPVTGLSKTLINIEQAAEISNLTLRLNNQGIARISTRICDQCELITLQADASASIKRGQTHLSLQQAATLKNKGATVIYNPATLQVTRIIFWN
ncbi:MAG: hypothetical protein KJO35_07245 [Gammaproteobacteria bacterium]|nr:hypothetical protein [Gammaproteobacteria bacterium]